MTAQQISKVWSVVSLVLLYYALNTYLVTQGASAIFGATLIVSKRIPAAMLGIPICSFLLLLTSVIGIHFASKNGKSWASRIPLVGFEQIDTSAREAKAYQGVMLFALSFLPALSLVHFWIVVWTAKIATSDSPPVPIPGGIWDWSALTSLNDPARICTSLTQITDPSRKTIYACEENVTILPGLEPLAFAVLTLVTGCATLQFWHKVFVAPSGAIAQATPDPES